MSSDPSQKEQLALQAEYYKIRLEHTWRHTMEQSRLTYLVTGGVLAFLYFVISQSGAFPFARTLIVGSLLLAGVINFLQGVFLRINGSWYRSVRRGYAKLLKLQENELIQNTEQKGFKEWLLECLVFPFGSGRVHDTF